MPGLRNRFLPLSLMAHMLLFKPHVGTASSPANLREMEAKMKICQYQEPVYGSRLLIQVSKRPFNYALLQTIKL